MSKIERFPNIPGSNPQLEDRLEKGIFVNERALEVERIHLYDGQPRSLNIHGQTHQVATFIEISSRYFAKTNEKSGRSCVNLGYRDLSAGTESFHSYSGLVDPIHLYRTVKVLEFLPDDVIVVDGFEEWNWRGVYSDAEGIFQSAHEKESESRYEGVPEGRVAGRKRIAELIREAKFAEIGQLIPDDLDEWIALIRSKDITVGFYSIGEEIKRGRLMMSEFYLEGIAETDKQLDKAREAIESMIELLKEDEE